MKPRDLALGLRAAGLRLTAGADAVRGWVRRSTAAHQVLAHAATAVVLFVTALVITHVQHQTPPFTAAGMALAAGVYAGFALVQIMHWSPWLLLAATIAGPLAMMAAGTPDAPVGLALVAGMFIFALRSEKTATIIGTAAVTLALVLAGHTVTGLDEKTGISSLVSAWVWLAAATGQAIRATRAHQAVLEERARRAEADRDAEARRRVQAERLRIARELHDAVGHHVALITVQAGAMTYLLDTDPVKARRSLEHIQQAGEAALEELRLTVGLLRQPGESPTEPTEPAGRLGRLQELIASFTATGLPVTCHITGQARALPEAVDLTAYRLIQESLTNTAKHAAGATTRVTLAYRPGTLALTIEDDGTPHSAHDPNHVASEEEGHGLIGMRERAAALSGRLTAGPRPEGGFRVTAALPAPALPATSGPAQTGQRP